MATARQDSPEKLRKNVSVVFVDDASTMTLILRNLLGKIGFNKDRLKMISGKNAGQDTIGYLESMLGIDDALSYQIPDIVFLDWNMDVTGIDILRKLRALAPRDPRIGSILVVMVTAEAEKDKIVSAIQSGVNSYIVKPLNAEQVEKKLSDMSAVQLGLAKKLEKEMLEKVQKGLLSDKDKKKGIINVIAKANSAIALDIMNKPAQDFREDFVKRNEKYLQETSGKNVVEGAKLSDGGLYRKAAGNFTEAANLDSENPAARIGLGRMQMKETNYAGAVKSFEAALELLPNNPEALELLGEARLKYADETGDAELYDTAIECLRAAVKLHGEDSGRANCLKKLGQAFAGKDDHENAAQSFKASLELDKGEVSAMMNLAVALKKAGRTDEATAALKKAGETTPRLPHEFIALGKVWLEKDDPKKAVDYFKEGLKHENASKEDVELYEDVVKALLSKNLARDAMPVINAIAGSRPDLYNSLGLAIVRCGKTKEDFTAAVNAYTNALKNDITGERYAYFHNRGMAYEKAGDKDKAVADFKEAFALHPNVATAKVLEALGVDSSKIQMIQ